MKKLIAALLSVLTTACVGFAPSPVPISTGEGSCPGIRVMWADVSGAWGSIDVVLYTLSDPGTGGNLGAHINEGYTVRLCISNGEFRSEWDLQPGDADFPYSRDWHYSIQAPQQ